MDNTAIKEAEDAFRVQKRDHIHSMIFGSQFLPSLLRKCQEIHNGPELLTAIRTQCNSGTADIISHYGANFLVSFYERLSSRNFPDMDDILNGIGGDPEDCERDHCCAGEGCGGCECCNKESEITDKDEEISNLESRIEDLENMISSAREALDE